jgi:hypothetical protein
MLFLMNWLPPPLAAVTKWIGGPGDQIATCVDAPDRGGDLPSSDGRDWRRGRCAKSAGRFRWRRRSVGFRDRDGQLSCVV